MRQNSQTVSKQSGNFFCTANYAIGHCHWHALLYAGNFVIDIQWRDTALFRFYPAKFKHGIIWQQQIIKIEEDFDIVVVTVFID